MPKLNLGCTRRSDGVFFSDEWAYIRDISARPKGRAPSYPEPAGRRAAWAIIKKRTRP